MSTRAGESVISNLNGEITIVPYQRIEEMEYFYTSESVKNDKVLEVVDLKDKKKFSEEAQGLWVLEQIEAVLDILRVKNFVLPKDKDGVEIPVIGPREEYFEAFKEAKRSTIANIVDAQDAREAYIDILKLKMEKAKGRRQTVYQQDNDEQKDDGDEDHDHINISNEAEKEAVNEEYVKAYAKWNKEQQTQNEDMMRQENIIESCRKHSSHQHDEDIDAVNRLLSSLFLLKKFIQGLIKKFPFIEEVVRQKRKDGFDPYDVNDMRSCYGNMLDRYRQGDEMGILTTIMSGMAEKQGNKSMSAFLVGVEDWHQTMIRLGVQSISMSDLAAIITLKGMNEKHRVEFLQQENALELTLDTLDTEEDDEKNEDSSSVSVRKEKKSLLVRVKKFIQQDKNRRLMNQRLSGGSGISNAPSSEMTRKEAEVKLREAQNVFVTTLDKSICKSYATTGNCRFGSSCKYKHEETVMSKSKVQATGQPKNGKSNNVCFQWRDYGQCRFGDSCNFRHEESEARKEVVSITKEVVVSGTNKEVSKEDNNKSKVNQSLFTVDDHSESWGNKDESVSCIITSDASDETVLSVSHQGTSQKLGWDSMASIHVSSDKNLLHGVTELRHKRNASGMGGTLPITHTGYSNMFNLQMHVIPGGNTPNIKSMGKALQTDGDGTEYVAIFTGKGATQISLTPRSKQQIMQVLAEAEDEQKIIGTAIQRNGVYEESFGEEEEVKPTTEEQAFAVTSMYTSRVPMSSADDIIGMLVSACVKEDHLIAGVKSGSIKGLPECVTVDAVKQYFKTHGKDHDVIMAEVANAPLKVPLDYEKEVFMNAGEHLQIDNVDPSFARVQGEKSVVKSQCGYRDGVIALDNSGYSVVIGRENKKDPHLVVKRFMKMWLAKWNRLKKLSADNEFVTKETMMMCEQLNVSVRQAVPYDHKRGLGASEGLNRWVQDCAQAHMNRLTVFVKLGLMSEHDKRSLWFHALTYANDVKLLAPSKINPTKTQFEEGESVPFNFSKYVILPFGLRVVIRKKQGDQDGRGIDGIYVGFSKVVTGGILVYMFTSKRVVQKYTFIPREPMPSLSDVDCEYAALALYGDLTLQEKASRDDTAESVAESAVRGGLTEVRGEKNGAQVNKEKEWVRDKHTKKKVVSAPVNTHFTRSKRSQELVLHVSEVKPPKPKVPTRQAAAKCPRWQAAYKREIKKINEENVLQGLPTDQKGKFIRPENAIVMRLLAVLEWKWKPDPETDVEGWLECVRIVCDGSADKREGEVTYAETPDRTLMFLMASVEATLGISSKVGDAIRAYLNAPSLDKNLVVIADKSMTSGTGVESFAQESLLIKGLYGSTKGALSFQVWADSKLDNIGYKKCDVARGVYVKQRGEDLVRLYRHSDDFKISAKSDQVVDEEVKSIQSQIRTTEFKRFKEFLGCTFERYNSETMVRDVRGDIFLVTMVAQINKLAVEYGHLSKQYNPTGRVRYTPLPLKPMLHDNELNDIQKTALSEAEVKEYMSLVMSIGWIVGNVRPNLKFSHHVIAKRLANPRIWDMYMAVWVMDHIILTKEWPLVIGGASIDPEVYSDASFASMEERRTVGGHVLVTGPKSGVIHAQVKTYKVAVKSIFEGECMAASAGQDTMIYATNVMNDLQYPSQHGYKVHVDNTATIDWMLGSVPSKSSKHMEVRLYRSRHLVQAGDIVMEHIATEQNMADLLTKSLPRKQYEQLSIMMLGHELVEPEKRFWMS